MLKLFLYIVMFKSLMLYKMIVYDMFIISRHGLPNLSSFFATVCQSSLVKNLASDRAVVTLHVFL